MFQEFVIVEFLSPTKSSLLQILHRHSEDNSLTLNFSNTPVSHPASLIYLTLNGSCGWISEEEYLPLGFKNSYLCGNVIAMYM